MEGGWLGKGEIWSFWRFKQDPVSSVGDMEVDILSTLEGFLGKVEEENGVASWAPNTQKSLITKYTLETRRIPSPTHTHSSIFCGCCSQVVVYFLRWMLLSPCLVLQSPNEGQRVRRREFTETGRFCSAEEHQRGAGPLSSSTRGWRAR